MAMRPSVDGGEHPEAVLSSAVPPSDSTPNSSAVLSMVTPPLMMEEVFPDRIRVKGRWSLILNLQAKNKTN